MYGIPDKLLNRIQRIGSGEYTDLLYWNNVNNKFCQLTTRVWELTNIQMCQKPHILESKKNNGGMQSKMAFKICEGILCPSFCVEEFDAIVH